jgi:redox-sensitive bicupin YhaK (pirin superfamily)
LPRQRTVDAAGRKTELTIIAGSIGELAAPPSPPKSWAAAAEADVAIWTIKMDPGARLTLPPARRGTNRMLYFFRGSELELGGRSVTGYNGMKLRPDVAVELVNGGSEGELLLLQGKPIGEPVVQYGPFVMNTKKEIEQAFHDYQRTKFGGWPWPSDGPVHEREAARFAKHADGRVETALPPETSG